MFALLLSMTLNWWCWEMWLDLKVDANLVVIYNVGLMQHPIGELFERFDDGRYHVVRFTRDGSNSTIQVDNLPVQPKHPTGTSFRIEYVISRLLYRSTSLPFCGIAVLSLKCYSGIAVLSAAHIRKRWSVRNFPKCIRSAGLLCTQEPPILW